MFMNWKRAFDLITYLQDETEAVSGNTVSDNDARMQVLDSISDNMVTIEQLQDDISAFQKWVKTLPERLLNFGIKFAIAALILFVGSKFITLVRKLLKKSLKKVNVEQGVIQFLDSLVKVLLYAVLVVWIASYFGFETTSLIAVIGSAGVAIALALQGSLSNFTGGILILVLKPFRVGDYIIEDSKGNEGTVIEIQLFYTKLRTVDDKIVILPNGTLANTSLTNLNLSPYRRLIMNVGISYSSDIARAKEVIKKILDEEGRILHEQPVEIFVEALDASQVTIGYRFFVKNEDYWEVKWEITEKLKNRLDEEKIEIPFAQLDVHMKES